MSWQQAWEEGRTPWDRGAPVPALVELVKTKALPQGRALVPGAGSGYDILCMAGPNRQVTGLDLAPGAQKRFERLRKDAGVPEEQAEVIVADFFDWQADEPFDMIWDYTFLCAIEPQMRPRWAERMDELLKPDGELITLIFPVIDKAPDDGPPYAMSPELVRGLLEPTLRAHYMEPVEHPHPNLGGTSWLARWRR